MFAGRRLQALVVAVALVCGVSFATLYSTGGSEAATRRRPGVVDSAAIHTRWPIKHVVFILKENRSFDHMFSTFPGADGVTTGDDHGRTVPLRPTTGQRMLQAANLAHGYRTALLSYDNGKMDGFAHDPISKLYAYTQLHREQLPNYWRWASDFVLSDHVFTSVLGPSFPNHLYMISGQSGQTHDNPRPRPQDPGWQRAHHYKTWGCDAPEWLHVKVYPASGGVVDRRPCFSFRTMGDELQAAHVPWAYYAARPEEPGYIWSAYAAIRQVRERRAAWDRHVFPVDNVVQDIRANRLPPVTWITPRFQLSDHPEFNFCYGENWSTQVIDAIMRSPMWKDTAIFLSWDDWGGFYDHVKPPRMDRFGYGFRVPFLVISPYALQGVVDHHFGDFSSVLKFIEDNWGLPPLNSRDRAATDLSYDFDFTQQPRPPDPLPARTDCKGPIWGKPR